VEFVACLVLAAFPILVTWLPDLIS
jgi:hypothetical protein